MKITLISVGKLKDKYLRDGVAEFAKRLSRFCDFEEITVEDLPAGDSMSPAQELDVIAKESERIRKKIRSGSFLVAMDLSGEMVTSPALCEKIQKIGLSGKSHITFLIGGSLGLDRALVRECDWKLCLSPMTFPHGLAKLLLTEQIYRAMKIGAGETYHK